MSSTKSNRFRVATTALILLTGALPLAGQTPVERERRVTRDTSVQLAPASDAPGDLIQRGPLLDAPISRTEYRLGPGDQIVVAIFGDINQVYALQVQPEGSVVVPGLGMVNVLDLNLEEAEVRIDTLVRRYYRNARTGVSLAAVRMFKVFVVGDVDVPGVRTATAATRVSEILDDDMAQEGRWTERRNVILRRTSGDSLLVDIARFFQVGDLAANPVLREGDVIVVPSMDRIVRVSGRVRYPAVYQYRPGESLADLLTVANGGAGFPADAADSIRVARTSGDERHILELARADAVGPAGQTFIMEPFDAVYVAEKADFGRESAARITGQVRYPGTYPVRPDTTTARDLVEMAGGFLPDASIARATLHRNMTEWRAAATDVDSIPMELLSESERDVLRVRLQSDASMISIGFHEFYAQGRDAGDLTLQDGDAIHVPEQRNEVLVLGAVNRPGIVAWAEGLSPASFIETAGGATNRAEVGSASVIRSRTGTRVQMRDVRSIDAGDTVIVPFSRDVDWFQRIQLITGIATAVTGLALTAITLF